MRVGAQPSLALFCIFGLACTGNALDGGYPDYLSGRSPPFALLIPPAAGA